MTTYPPIQPRPILCKTPTTNNVQSTPMFLVQSPTIPNTNFYQANTDMNTNSAPPPVSSLPSMPLTPHDEFLRRLRDFHRGRQTPFRFLPTIAGQVVDLHLLYNTVKSYGGWDKVSDRQLWPTIASSFSIDSSCLNGTQALKNIYIRYLYAFEKVNNGENIDAYDEENEDAKRRTVLQLQRVPQSYNHGQHIISDAMRVQHGLFNDFVRRSEFEKLELALLCGFPNELTFTLNTLLHLSSSSIHTKSFHLYKCPRLLDLLFRHSGLFSETEAIPNDHSLKSLYDNLWSKHLNYQMDSFWIQSCTPKILKLLLNIDVDKLKYKSDKNFNLNMNDNQHEREFRMEQILMIIRNLSFDRVNALYLLETMRLTSSIAYVFLLLISYCENQVELQKYAFDIWSNLAIHMHLSMINHDEGLFFRQLLQYMLNGDDDQYPQQQQDRLKIIRALEIISSLARAGSDNGIYLVNYVDVMVKTLIHIPDILILVHCLECLYQLSELGEQLCDTIVTVQSPTSIITTLIDLLTIEARSFSTDAIKTIKIIELSSGPPMLPSYHQPPMVAQQPIVFIPSNQPTQQHQIYPMDNVEMNRNPPRFILQTNSKPLTLNLLSVSTAPTQNPSTIMANVNDRKRKFDCIVDAKTPSLSEVLTRGTLPYSTQSRPMPPANSLVVVSSTNENNTATNSIHSTMNDLLDRCSSQSVDNDVRLCLNDLCQRVDQLIVDTCDPIPSPKFKRKMETQTPRTADINHKDEQAQTNTHHHQSMRPKPSVVDVSSNGIVATEKRDESSDHKLLNVVPNVMSTALPTVTIDYVCEWENCRISFTSARAVFHHVCSVHVKNSSDYVCLWYGCDHLKRQKWSLISHIQERHCSDAAFRQAKLRLTNPMHGATANINPLTSNLAMNSNSRILTSGSVSYMSETAWLAIRRYMQVNAFDEQINRNKEGPLTKSIRLTAALVLRNIARYSSIGKQNLRQYEQIIANLALEPSEASHTLSSCLFELCH